MRESRGIGSDSKDGLTLLGLEVGEDLFLENPVVVIKDLRDYERLARRDGGSLQTDYF